MGENTRMRKMVTMIKITYFRERWRNIVMIWKGEARSQYVDWCLEGLKLRKNICWLVYN